MRGPLGSEVVVVIQRQASSTQTILTLPFPYQEGRMWVDALSGEMIHEMMSKVDQRVTMLTLPPLPAYSVHILIPHDQWPDCLEMSP